MDVVFLPPPPSVTSAQNTRLGKLNAFACRTAHSQDHTGERHGQLIPAIFTSLPDASVEAYCGAGDLTTKWLLP